jgi:hypothetical protein
VPPQHRQLVQGFGRVDTHTRIPSSGGKYLAVGTDLETLLARMLGLGDLERFPLEFPNLVPRGQGMFGQNGIRR